MKNKRGVLFAEWIICCLLVFFGLSKIPVQADNSEASGKCGEDVSWTFDRQTGVMTISGSGAMWDFRDDAEEYDYHECPWEEWKPFISTVRFQGSVTVVGADSFYNCWNLQVIEFTDSITDIHPFAFMGCPIRSLQLPPMLECLGQQCFWGSLVEAVVIPDSVWYLGDGFSGCPELKYVYIGVPSGGYIYDSGVFANCPKLETIEVSPDNIALKSVDGVLFSKDGKTLVQYPGGKKGRTYSIPEGVTSVERCSFWGVENLKTVIFPDSIEYIDGVAFSSDIENYVFRGDVPAFDDRESLNIWNNPRGYYPRYNKTWTDPDSLGLSNEDGLFKVTWIPYGWEKSSDGWTFVDYDGVMKKNTWLKTGGKWYYFDRQGLMQTGWQKISDKWYYFNTSGAMVTGWQEISGKWYYFSASGSMVTGWKQLNGKWYYFKSSGAMQTGWQEISGKTYYFKSSGAMAANEWCGGWWLNANGTWTYNYKASWKQNAKGWWYGDTSGWYAKNCTITIDGKSYTFDANGYMQ